ncbi:SigB/SigF/SigG family RNA polymerase sigma factor [Nocardia sp. alder85J]|uniref:SigB/SigF/SigG family RNA polymerase sigma factor n=1 Tax=Nocardia sp. alder85J TaxID=2862949 RepID=UPI001CD43F74|nr:SigB/SigF/SigG family RNA polymerase sigma factor [Nocardia sp. alder85J]MCX4093894.1 SigB/SigF/SigG family RNA polymerase sigma factor [Nocardia sp. alder85J]
MNPTVHFTLPRITPPRSTRIRRRRRDDDNYDRIPPLLAELAGLALHDPRRDRLRKKAIGLGLPLAEHIARRFTGRGEAFDDLLQVARLGLVQAVDRFEPGHGTPFIAFAVPTIMGEVRRHFRDHTWGVRVPRRTKDIHQLLGPTTERLTHRLGRSPRAREIAEELDVETAEVTLALIAQNAYRADPIEAATDDEDGVAPTVIPGVLAVDEPGYRLVEDYLAVRPLIAALPARDQRVLVLRFFEFRTQVQIAEALGISQMQVSRILAGTLNTLREQALRP